AFASTGNDTADLTGSAGNDSFYGLPTYGYMNGTGFLNYVNGFDQVTAHAGAGGTDTAYLYDSTGNDSFTASPTTATLSGTGFSNTATSFALVNGYASTGTDTADLT